MGMEDYTSYQQGIIRRYYANQDKVQFQRLQELCTDLYLSKGNARKRVWKSIVTALKKLDVPQDRIEHLIQKDDAELLARLIKDLDAR